MPSDLSADFACWLDACLRPLPGPEVRAFNLNLYDVPFRAELVGSTYFDASDEDWACEEAWSSDVARFDFPADLSDEPWEQRQSLARTLFADWLAGSGAGAVRLRQAEAVAIGFVDGSLVLVHGGRAN